MQAERVPTHATHNALHTRANLATPRRQAAAKREHTNTHTLSNEHLHTLTFTHARKVSRTHAQDAKTGVLWGWYLKRNRDRTARRRRRARPLSLKKRLAGAGADLGAAASRSAARARSGIVCCWLRANASAIASRTRARAHYVCTYVRTYVQVNSMRVTTAHDTARLNDDDFTFTSHRARAPARPRARSNWLFWPWAPCERE